MYAKVFRRKPFENIAYALTKSDRVIWLAIPVAFVHSGKIKENTPDLAKENKGLKYPHTQ